MTSSFVLAGHTKSVPDWYFRLFKRKFRYTKTNSLDDIVQDRQNCLHQHQASSFPGCVVMDLTWDATYIPKHDLPAIVRPAGPSQERKQYLYDKFRHRLLMDSWTADLGGLLISAPAVPRCGT